jgi:7-cyano-7-deazaguanine reductase
MVKITQETKTNKVEGTLLGQRVSAPEFYSPDILVMVPRSENREQYGITNDTFNGYDDWYAYECSCLTDYGIPVQFALQITYTSDSKYIVESKSLKLYLNSFNMERMGRTIELAKQNFIIKVLLDLQNRLGLPISKKFNNTIEVKELDVHTDLTHSYTNIYSIVDTYNVTCTEFNETPEVLKENPEYKTLQVYFDGYRSNCKITNQPDYATVFINISSNIGTDPSSLLKYLTSFRNESHFHEECCEAIFERLTYYYKPSKLLVRCNYTRRGGIDINPTRYSGSILPLGSSRTYFQ